MPKVTGIYQGDVARYWVQIYSTKGATSKVKILMHLSDDASIPIGAIVTLPSNRIVKD